MLLEQDFHKQLLVASGNTWLKEAVPKEFTGSAE